MKIPSINDKQAVGVLSALRKLVDAWLKESSPVWLLSRYVNGREQGFNIASLTTARAASWAEHRHSDSIVVYTGELHEFEQGTRIPSEEVWSNSRLFGYHEYGQAALFIRDFLHNKD
jgi:hypothetical protein